jgi:hypothetical protein
LDFSDFFGGGGQYFNLRTKFVLVDLKESNFRQVDKAGKYTCKISNNYGTLSKTVTVKVGENT